MHKNDERMVICKMHELGIRERRKGAAMLRTAVRLYHPGVYLTKELYPAVAKIHATTAVAAEKAMRDALREAELVDQHGRNAGFFDADGNTSVGDFLAAMKVFLDYGV